MRNFITIFVRACARKLFLKKTNLQTTNTPISVPKKYSWTSCTRPSSCVVAPRPPARAARRERHSHLPHCTQERKWRLFRRRDSGAAWRSRPNSPTASRRVRPFSSGLRRVCGCPVSSCTRPSRSRSARGSPDDRRRVCYWRRRRIGEVCRILREGECWAINIIMCKWSFEKRLIWIKSQ